MIAIVGDQLAVGDMGELGPLDVQVTKPNEIQERGSGLDIMQSLYACMNHAQQAFHENFLHMRQNLRMSTRQAGELASKIASDLLAPLYGQIDPLRIGELQRATAITLDYGKRLNTHSNNLKQNALEKLVSGYPAHGFVIDRKEAKELFNSVVSLTELEKLLCDKLWTTLGTQSGNGPVFLTCSNGKDNHGSQAPEIAGSTTKPSQKRSNSGITGDGSKKSSAKGA
jgi:hypothetical protein